MDECVECVVVRVEFRGDLASKFEEVKKSLGLQNSTDLLRFLVSEKYKEITARREGTVD